MIRRVWPLLCLAIAAPLCAETTAIEPAPITAAELRAHVAVLAGDDYGGRAPDSEGGRKTVHYIATQWNDAGLQPGADAADGGLSWYQPVSMVTRRPLSGSARFFTLDGKPVPIADRSVLLSGRADSGRLDGARLVFTGYGIAEGAPPPDLTGRIALMLAGHARGETRTLAERAATLARAGAEGVLLIFDEDDRVSSLRGTWFRKASELADDDARAPRFYGGIGDEAARKLFAASGDTLVEARLRADQNPGLIEPLALTADLTARSQNERLSSYNVIGKLPGRDPKAGAVMLLGHWDHLGVCRPEGAPHRICNGAVDNASGIAVLIEVAERLAKAPPLDRDVYFVATTGEEIGLLGAKAFAEHPPVPLDRIVAAFNLDTVAVAPAGEPVAIIGRGKTPIAADVGKVARAVGRQVDADDDANAYIKRQDGWMLLQKGVPTVMANGAFSDSTRLQAFLGGAYHTPDDRLTDDTDLTGAAEDADLHVALARYFADESSYPGPG